MNCLLILFHFVNHEIVSDMTENLMQSTNIVFWAEGAFHFVTGFYCCYYYYHYYDFDTFPLLKVKVCFTLCPKQNKNLPCVCVCAPAQLLLNTMSELQLYTLRLFETKLSLQQNVSSLMSSFFFYLNLKVVHCHCVFVPVTLQQSDLLLNLKCEQ